MFYVLVCSNLKYIPENRYEPIHVEEKLKFILDILILNGQVLEMHVSSCSYSCYSKSRLTSAIKLKTLLKSL